jgi:hypothetical protein
MKTMLVRYPPDAWQRVENGFDTRLFCILNKVQVSCCLPGFDFAAMCANINPFATLPVLFRSSQYQSTRVKPLVYDIFSNNTEYWIGPTPTKVLDYTNAKEPSAFGTQYYACCGSDGLWYQPTTVPFRSVTGTVLFYQFDKVRTKKNNVEAVIGDFDYDVLDLFLSGDGSTYFKLSRANSPVWYRWDGLRWFQLNGNIAIAASFDGAYSCTAFWNVGGSLEVTMYFGSVQKWTMTISSLQHSFGYTPYLAMIDSMVYIACRNSVYSAGLKGVFEIQRTVSACTGIWTKGQAIWVGTTNGTELSTDAGWTWTFQPELRAVNAGLYIWESQSVLYTSDPASFRDDVQYPLELTNRGLLRSADGWNNAFELKDDKWQNGLQIQDNDAFTVINQNTRYATSPNGLFLLDNPPNGDAVLYFNVWKTAKFQEWCAANQTACNVCLARYCNLMQDPECQTGDVDPIPITPTPQPTPTTPSKPFPMWIIGLIVGVVVLIAIGATILVKRSK